MVRPDAEGPAEKKNVILYSNRQFILTFKLVGFWLAWVIFATCVEKRKRGYTHVWKCFDTGTDKQVAPWLKKKMITFFYMSYIYESRQKSQD